MNKIVLLLLPALCGLVCMSSCKGPKTLVPKAPDYTDATMWYTVDGDPDGTGADVFYIVSTWEEDWTDAKGRISHYADVWNPTHRERMGIEIGGVAAYMAPGNRFWAPYYRHATIDAFLTRDDDTIRERTRLMMRKPFRQEVESLLAKGYSADLPSMRSLGYRHMVRHIKGEWTLEEATETLITDTRRYAKRQLTWFRAESGVHWLDRDKDAPLALIETLLRGGADTFA